MHELDARVKTFIIDILKKDKTLTEREVKASVRKGLKLGREPLNASIIREVRRGLGIDRPRAISYARNLLAKNPTLEAKKVIKDVSDRFGISLGAPDVSRLRPAAARREKAPTAPGVGRPQLSRQGTYAPAAKEDARAAGKVLRSPGLISISYEAEGDPSDIARFFRSLAW